jgi:hypothetical protein
MPPISEKTEKDLELMFDKTLDTFVTGLSPDDAAVFLDWFEAHSTDENLFALLLQTYPKFGVLLAEAMEKFDAEH